MIKIAICGDNKSEQLQLAKIINKFEQNYVGQYNIHCNFFENGMDLLANIENGSQFHIIILDIIMPFANGIEIAKGIGCVHGLSKIIFITS